VQHRGAPSRRLAYGVGLPAALASRHGILFQAPHPAWSAYNFRRYGGVSFARDDGPAKAILYARALAARTDAIFELARLINTKHDPNYATLLHLLKQVQLTHRFRDEAEALTAQLNQERRTSADQMAALKGEHLEQLRLVASAASLVAGPTLQPIKTMTVAEAIEKMLAYDLKPRSVARYRSILRDCEGAGMLPHHGQALSARSGGIALRPAPAAADEARSS
jgi:hypothetical protein